MLRRSPFAALLVAAGLLRFAAPAHALEECRLMRQPDIEGSTIVFVYAGDLWTVPRSGGAASRLTAHDGLERFPKLSPTAAPSPSPPSTTATPTPTPFRSRAASPGA